VLLLVLLLLVLLLLLLRGMRCFAFVMNSLARSFSGKREKSA
jgi:hypothetical protein